MVKVILFNDGKVDFYRPPYMNQKQQDIFIKEMKKIFSDIKLVDVLEKTREQHKVIRGGDAGEWTVEEYVLLLSGLDPEEIYEKMNGRRSVYAITLRIGDFVRPYLDWASKQGYPLNPDKNELKRLIKKFLEEVWGQK